MRKVSQRKAFAILSILCTFALSFYLDSALPGWVELMKRRVLEIITLMAVILAGGCSTIKRLPPPGDAMVMAEIPGIPVCRSWGDDALPKKDWRVQLFRDQVQSDPAYDPDAPVHFLAISGGAQEGAFGAGLLKGWSDSGSRPEFRVVTGVSSGAFLAPFAFLGSEYDEVGRTLFSRYSSKDVVETRIFSALFRGESLSDNKKLRKIVSRHFTPVEMEKVAVEYARGRRLFIGSTNLDTVRPVIWDIGAIASSGQPGAYELIIDVIMASSAFPGIFPPQLFRVEQDGELFDELHVDGGPTSQVFIFPISFEIREALEMSGLNGPAHIYVLRNAPIIPRVEEVEPKTIPILKKTAESLVNTIALMDMHHIYLDAQDNQIEFHVAYMPSDFRKPDEVFDPVYMRELFDFAYQQGQRGGEWESEVPGFNQAIKRRR